MQYNTTRCIDENQDNETLKRYDEKWGNNAHGEKKIDGSVANLKII
jgi:hypothetical protein